MFYAWLGVTMALRLRPGPDRRTIAVSAGIALAALIGLSRVYLGVHYLSDVSAGWGLGVAAFAGAAAVALVLSHIRQNVRRADRIAFAPVLARIGLSTSSSAPPGVISVAAFAGLILVPALGSFSRGWEKLAAGVLSLFVLAALVLVGLVIGFLIFYNWDSIGV